MLDSFKCDLCHKPISPHAHYIVRMDIFADPSMAAVTTEQWQAADFADEMAKLLKELEQFTGDELQDQVHRRLEYRLCVRCHRTFLANPLGLPRGIELAGTN